MPRIQTDPILRHTQPIRLRAVDCSLLAERLVAKAPAELRSYEREALDAVLDAAAAVDASMVARSRSRRRPLVGAQRVALVRAWDAYRTQLSIIARIPAEVDSIGARAAQVQAQLFPRSLSFAGSAPTVWDLSKILLERIDEEGLAPRLDEVVAPVLRQAVIHAHEAMRAALFAPRADAFETELVRRIARFVFTVSAYARALSLRVRFESEPDLLAYDDALSPIAMLRKASHRRGQRRRAADARHEENQPSDEDEPGAA